MTITATIAGAVSMLANFALFFGGGERRNGLGFVGLLLVSILAPVAAMLVQMAISRTREFEADREGAEISGRPLWLASALSKIERAAGAIPNPEGAGQSGDGAYVHHQPAAWRQLVELFAEPSLDRGARRKLRAMAGQPVQQPGPWA